MDQNRAVAMSIEQNTAVPQLSLNSVEFKKRKLSYLEYAYACSGLSKRSIEKTRENTIILEGQGMVDADEFRRAIEVATQANPAAAIKLVGDSLWASWAPGGQLAQVRVVKNCTWDGMSEKGSEFIYETPLDLRAGVCCEFLLVEGVKNFIIFRNHHAVMDGMGTMHFFADVFRALRGELLEGTNSLMKDTELMQSVETEQFRTMAKRPLARPTGDAVGDDIGDCWRRFTIDGPQIFLMPRVAIALANYAREAQDGDIVISVPVNMRRHKPEMKSTMNFTCISYVKVEEGDCAAKFQKKLHKQLRKNSEAFYIGFFNVFRTIPLRWIDGMWSRNRKTHLQNKGFESAMVSDMSSFQSADYSAAGFTAQTIFGVPIPSITYCLLCGMGDKVSVTLGMPNSLGSDGRIDKLVEHLQQTFAPKD